MTQEKLLLISKFEYTIIPSSLLLPLSILYFDGQPRTGSWSFNAEIEVIDEKTQNSGSGDHCINVFTRTGMGITGGYWNGLSLGHAFFK